MTMNEAGEPRSAAEVLADLVKQVEGVKELKWIRDKGANLAELDRLIEELGHSPEVAQRLPLALVSHGDVQPGQTHPISVQPCVTFRAESLLVAPHCDRFRLRLRSGVVVEQLGIEFLPASCFISAAVETMQEALRRMVANAWRCNRVDPYTFVGLDVVNEGSAAQRFEAVLWGRVVQ